MSNRAARGGRGRSAGALRRIVGALCGGVLVAGAGLAGAAASPVEPDGLTEARAKFEPAVAEELRQQGETTVLVRFADRPDLGAFSQIESWAERGQAVYDALAATAERSQADARAALDEAGADYESYAISNAILIPSGDRDLLTTLATDPAVEGVYVPARYEVPDPVRPEAGFAPAAVEWGVADINADDVWNQLGVRGEGIVVGSLDTGVDYDHPALVRQYRGNNGDGTFDHDYSWFDASGTGAAAPTDLNGHGTHTTGTLVGDDGAGNQIGVAPGARWVAANGCCPSDGALVAAGEWLLAPTDRQGNNPMPALRPHIVNNSWGTNQPSVSPFLVDVTEAWTAAGMFAVFSNGNFGSSCGTSTAPGSLAANYSVGAYGATHTIAPSSSRGAGEGGEIKPNIAAPGVNVRSAAPGGGYSTHSGTSMATPHVAGAVALLWSAAPELVGDVEATRQLLDGSATDSANTTCGGTAADNNVFGEGRLDALALLTEAGVGPRQVVRVSGTDRYGTAARVAEHFAPGVDTVFVASGTDFPDALAGAARAGSLGGPVLLVGRTTVPEAARLQLERLRPANVVIAGGTGAVSTAVETALEQILPAADVTRRAGSNRYETAARIAADVPSSDVVLVASGRDFPDALAGAALAGSLDAPLLLMQPTSVPQAARAQLERLAPEEIIVLGGETAVPGTVVTQLSAYGTVRRVSGTDRFGTAAAVAGEWPSAQEAYVATGLDWPDALAGAARAAATDSPVLLVRTGSVPAVTGAALQRLDPARTFVLGGSTAVADTVLGQLRQLR